MSSTELVSLVGADPGAQPHYVQPESSWCGRVVRVVRGCYNTLQERNRTIRATVFCVTSIGCMVMAGYCLTGSTKCTEDIYGRPMNPKMVMGTLVFGAAISMALAMREGVLALRDAARNQ